MTGLAHRLGMDARSPDRTGVLILRLWAEASHETGLRARITKTLGPSATEQPVAVAASADDICTVVRDWIEAFQAVT